MTEIHGMVYLIIGSFLAISSRILDANKGESKLTLFVIAGIVMVLVGIIKLVKGSSPKEKKHKTHPHVPYQSTKKFCHSCGLQVNTFQKFCHSCGEKLFK